MLFGAIALGGGACTTTTPSTSIEELAAGTGTTWFLDYDPDVHTVSFAEPQGGPVTLPAATTQADAVLELLDRYKAAFGMEDPKTQWTLARTTTDDLGLVHLTFQQQIHGIHVFNAVWIASILPTGELWSMHGRFIPDTDAVDLKPAAITPTQAVSTAEADLMQRLPGVTADQIRAGTGDAFVFMSPASAKSAVPTLTVAVNVSTAVPAAADFRTYVIDAQTGAIVSTWVTGSSATAYGTGFGATHYAAYGSTMSNPESFPIGTSSSGFAMKGTSNGGTPIETRSLATSVDFTSASSSEWSDACVPCGASVDAQTNFAAIADAYAETFGQHSYDNASGPWVLSLGDVQGSDKNLGQINANLWWGKSGVSLPIDNWISKACQAIEGTITIGNGLNHNTGQPLHITSKASSCTWAGATVVPFSSSLDISAHEFTHGISECMWGGNTQAQWEAYVVNEVMSDVLGEYIASKVPGSGPSFYFGRNTLTASNAYVRNLSDPTDPLRHQRASLLLARRLLRHGNDDIVGSKNCAPGNSDVAHEMHIASQVGSYAWYLMTYGGVHKTTGQQVPCGIGWDASGKLWWNVEKTLQPNPTFKSLALLTISAAKATGALGGASGIPQSGVTAVACAWLAVGVIKADEVKQQAGVTCPAPDPSVVSAASSPTPGMIDPTAAMLTNGGVALTQCTASVSQGQNHLTIRGPSGLEAAAQTLLTFANLAADAFAEPRTPQGGSERPYIQGSGPGASRLCSSDLDGAPRFVRRCLF